MISFLPYIQIGLSVILVGLVLLQHSDASIGSAFGGDSLGSAGHTRRGPEKFIFVLTIIIGVLFAATAFSALILK